MLNESFPAATRLGVSFLEVGGIDVEGAGRSGPFDPGLDDASGRFELGLSGPGLDDLQLLVNGV